MTGFGDIIGHEQIIEHFKSALKNHQVSHAYILNGENVICVGRAISLTAAITRM